MGSLPNGGSSESTTTSKNGKRVVSAFTCVAFEILKWLSFEKHSLTIRRIVSSDVFRQSVRITSMYLDIFLSLVKDYTALFLVFQVCWRPHFRRLMEFMESGRPYILGVACHLSDLLSSGKVDEWMNVQSYCSFALRYTILWTALNLIYPVGSPLIKSLILSVLTPICLMILYAMSPVSSEKFCERVDRNTSILSVRFILLCARTCHRHATVLAH